MNIRKEHDYSTLFSGIDQAIRAGLSLMELYCELGRLICARQEKGAAVAAATYLTEKHLNTEGFSARNVRRMRDFYRMYEDVPELLVQAMRLGWTQNVVILEADLTMEERAWYLHASEQSDWSKLTLQKKIAEAAHLKESSEPEQDVRVAEQDKAAAILQHHQYVQNNDQCIKSGAIIWGESALLCVFWDCLAKPRGIPWPRGEPRQFT